MATLSVGGTTVFDGGTLQSGVTFPTGMIRQIKEAGLGTGASNTTSFSMPSSAVQFDNAILSTSDVFLMTSGTVTLRDGHNDLFVHMFFTGGGLGATTSGRKFLHNLYNYLGSVHARMPFVGTAIDTNPGSTTPSYQVYMQKGSHNIEYEDMGDGHSGYLTLMEIIA